MILLKRWMMALVLALALALTGCGGDRPKSDEVAATDAPQGGITVVCSLFAPYDFAREIAGGTLATVEMLMNPGVDSHAFDPTPADILRIQQADLFIYVGGENEAWVETVMATVQPGRVLRLMDEVELLDEEPLPGIEDDHDHDHDEASAEADEHIWTSPANAIEMSRAIARALAEVDPANAAAYEKNLSRYTGQLAALDASFAAVVEAGVRREVVFGDRFPFLYFARRYGLQYYAAFPGCGHETEPSARTLAFLIEKVRVDAIPVVFHIEQGNERVARAIAEETGKEVLMLHSCHNISAEDYAAGETYLTLMQKNVGALKVALS